ncbi:MAG: hypothetical protein LBU62_07155, partial [Bacteroidales bacterium]|nr:hypothetical protein [Bacteroidales bacterium]
HSGEKRMFRVSSFELKTLNLKLKTRNFKLQPEVPFVSEKYSTSKKDLAFVIENLFFLKK